MDALIGRSIDEGQTVHGADWSALSWSAVGAGTIVPTLNYCKPEIAIIENGYHRGIRISSGKVLHDGEIYNVQEEVISLLNNLGNAERYDVVFLKYLQEENAVVPDVKIGDPAPGDEEPLHPELIEKDGEIVVPIAVVYLEKDATEITQLKDVRSVPNAEHLHRAGPGLSLDDDYLMNVAVDGDSVVINSSDELTIGEVGGHELDLVDAKGIDYYEYYDDTVEEWNFIYRVDEDKGLHIGSNNELTITPSDVTGDGLEVRTVDTLDKIHITDGDGLTIDSGQLVAKPGLGVKIASSSLGALKPDVIDGRGLAVGSEGISVSLTDVAGSGLAVGTTNLKVNAGNGLMINGDLVEVNRGEGITDVSGQIGLDLQSGGGLGIDSNNALEADAEMAVSAGDGLVEDADTAELHVGDGDGMNATATGLELDLGDGVRINDYLLEAHVAPSGGVDLNTELSLSPADFAGDGLSGGSYFHVKDGTGMTITNDSLTPNLKSGGGLTKSDTLEAAPEDFAGNYAKDWTKIESGQIEVAPDEMFNLIGEKTVTITSVGQREGIWFYDETNRFPVVIGIGFKDQADSLTEAIQLKKVMEDHNSESGAPGNDFFAGVECVGTIGGDPPGSADVLIRVYEVKMDSDWIYNY